MGARERLKESETAVRRDDVVVFLDRNLEMDKLFIIFSDSLSLLIRLTSHRKSFGFVPRRTNITKLLKTKEMTKYVTCKIQHESTKYHAENLSLSRLNHGH